MNTTPMRKCYLCGKPCWNKGCREHLSEGRHQTLAKYNNRKLKREQKHSKNGF